MTSDGTTSAHAPRSATETPRRAIRRLLADAPRSAYELSALVHLPEKEIAAHLEHLAQSLRHGDERLELDPARCLDCGFAFRDRRRPGRPSACPQCRGQHLAAPVFRITRRSA